MTQEEVVAKPFPVKGLILGLMFLPFFALWSPWLGQKAGYALGQGTFNLLDMGIGYYVIFTLFFAAITRFTGGKFKFSTADYIASYIVMMMGFVTGGPIQVLNAQTFYAGYAFPYIHENGWVANWWAAPKEAGASIILQRPLLDWGGLMPAMTFWIVFTLIWFAFQFSVPFLFSEQWVSAEALPYPSAAPLLEIWEQEENRYSILKNKFLWIGIVLALAVHHSSLIQVIDPSYPAIEFPSYSMASVRFLGSLDTNPFNYVVWLFFPTDIILSLTTGAYYFRNFLPAILKATGMVPESAGSWAFWGGSAEIPEWARNLSFVSGMLWGLGILTFFFSRDTLKKNFKAGLKKPFENPWALTFIGSLAAIYIIAIAVGTDVLIITLAFLWMIASYTMLTKVSAEAPTPGMCWHNINMTVGIWPFAAAGTNYSAVAWKTFTIQSHMMSSPTGAHHQQNPGFLASNSVFLAMRTGALSLKRLFFIGFIALVIATAIGYPLQAWAINRSGPTDFFWWWYTRWVGAGVETGLPGFEYPQPDLNVVSMVEGAIFAGILQVLRMRFAWFLINPVGFMIGNNLAGYSLSLPVMFLLKTILLRVFGVEIQKEKLMPFAIGYVFSWALLYLVLRWPLMLAMGKIIV